MIRSIWRRVARWFRRGRLLEYGEEPQREARLAARLERGRRS